MDDIRGTSCLRAQAELWAARSVPLPYDVELNIDFPDLILPLLSPLLPSIDRWRSLTITGERVEYAFLKIEPDTLCHLVVQIQDNELDLEDEEIQPKTTFTPGAMNVWVSQIPHPCILTPLRFTSLSISDNHSILHPHASPVSILDFLTACPELHYLSFTGSPRNDDPIPTSEPVPLVSLPHLHTLHLGSTCSTRVILSSLHAPRLESLYLGRLNVDLGLQDAGDESGDSEDESHDYSQSPWSDHATGMGLRKLIARSKPPIKILEMDYSDMRTKDFIYVFDRLNLLEKFLIVASDMSDKVIRLLRPSRVSGETTIRLPRLQRLELTNCQRLTGDAIVDALEKRVAYTDKHHPTSTLINATVAECEGFTVQHGSLLARTLGSRLRLE